MGQDQAVLSKASLNPSTIVLLKMNTDQLVIPEKIKQMREEHKDKPIAGLIDASQANLNSIRELAKGQAVYLSVDMPYTASVLAHAVAPKSVLASDLQKIASNLAPQVAVADRSTSDLTVVDIGTDLASARASGPTDLPAGKLRIGKLPWTQRKSSHSSASSCYPITFGRHFERSNLSCLRC